MIFTIRLHLFTKCGEAIHTRITERAYVLVHQPQIAGPQRMRQMSELSCLVEREIPRLRRYARALTRTADRADDLVQDTLVRALAKGHLWQPGTDIRAWLFTIMHNQYVNTVRRQARETATVDVEQVSSTLVATTDPTSSWQLRELDRALARLPDEQREVVLLVGLEGMAYDSAAQILRVPIGTVRSRLSRGRETLRGLMERQEEPMPASAATIKNIARTEPWGASRSEAA
jgi:RNA polymerase sigma-70 factor, ECF subfamily